MKHLAEAAVMIALFTFMYFIFTAEGKPAARAKTETLSCVRVKEVTPAGTINYLCEVGK